MNGNQKGTALVGAALTDEVMESSDSILTAGMYGQGQKGLQQFYSPPQATRLVAEVIGNRVAVLDPTAGDGSLLSEFDTPLSFGVEIDADQIKASEGSYNALKGDFQHFYTLLKLGISPWSAIVANPPFGLQWEDPTIRDGKPTNSTVLTFIMMTRLLAEDGQFAFICGQGRYERQIRTLPEHSMVYATVYCDDLFEGTREPTVIAFGMHDALRSPARVGVIDTREVNRDMLDLLGAWVKEQRAAAIDTYSRVATSDYTAYHRVNEFKAVQDEYDRRLEKRIKTREFDAQLSDSSHVQWMPSGFAKLGLQQAGLLYDFQGLNGQPVAYFSQNERLWFKISNAEERGLLTVDPKLRQAVSLMLGDIQRIRKPLYDLKPQQRLGFLEDVDSLVCIKDDPEGKFKRGEIYRLDTDTKTIAEELEKVVESKKNPGDYDTKKFIQFRKVMVITITGNGAARTIYDGGQAASEQIDWLINHFDVPEVPDVEAAHPTEIAALEDLVREVLNEFVELSAEWEKTNPASMPFTIREFQVKDIARLLFKEFGLLAWEQGLGKTVGGLAFAACAWKLRAKKKLMITTAGDLIPQWIRESERFLGMTPTVIKSHGQAKKIAHKLRQGGEGVFISHYEAMAINGTLRKNKAMPTITVKEWTEDRLVKGTDKYGYWFWEKNEEGFDPSVTNTEQILADAILANPDEERPAIEVSNNGRISNEAITAMLELGYIQKPTRQYYQDGFSCAYSFIRGRYEKLLKKLTSKDICPECHADTRNGWNGTFCEAEDEKGQTCGYAHFASKVKPIASLLSTCFHDGVALLDEITYIQGDTSKRSKALRGVQARYRLGLTGTPIKNYVDQIFWPLAWCLGYGTNWFPYEYDGGRTRFENDFCVIQYVKNGRRKENRKVMPDVTNLSRFWRMLASCTIRRRAEETGEDLVDIYYHEIHVPISVGQAEQTKEWLRKLPNGFPGFFEEKYPEKKVVQAGMHEIMAPLLGLNWKLDYAMTVPEADPDHDWTGINVDNWTPANLRTLELTMALVNKGRKVLVGSHIVAEGQWLAERLQEKGVNAVHIVDDNGTTVDAKKRAQRVYSFQTDEDVQVFCAGMKAIRLGHNLDAANAVVLNGLDFDYETFDQFIKRVRRLTSKETVDVFVLLPTLSGQQTITSRKWTLLNLKAGAADLALDGRLILKNEQEISETEMIRELQERGMTVTDDAVDSEDIAEAWEATPQLDDFNGESVIPPRPEKIEEETVEEPEPGDQLDLSLSPTAIIAEAEDGGAEWVEPEVDLIEAAEDELTAAEMRVYLVANATNSDDSPINPDLADEEESDELAETSAIGDGAEQPIPAASSESDTVSDTDAEVETTETVEEDRVPSGEVQSASPSLDYMGQLKQAKELLDIGVLDQNEFNTLKADLLAGLKAAA